MTQLTFWDIVVQYWVPIIGCAILITGFVTTIAVKLKKRIVAEVTRELNTEEDSILAGQQSELNKVTKTMGAAEKKYNDRKKFVDDRHKIDKDQNDSEHAGISERLDRLCETARLSVKSNSIILRVLIPMANGSKQEVKDMADEIDTHLLSKIK